MATNIYGSYKIVLDTMKLGDIRFSCEHSLYEKATVFTAYEPSSNVLVQLKRTLVFGTLAELPSSVKYVQSRLIDLLLRDGRSKPYVRRAIFNDIKAHSGVGCSFAESGANYGPYENDEAAFAAWLLLQDIKEDPNA